MPVLIVTSAQPGDGKAAVAVGLAAALRPGGSTVRLVRAPAGDSAPTGNSAPAGDHTAAFAPLGLPLLATLPQDRLLAAPSIAAKDRALR